MYRELSSMNIVQYDILGVGSFEGIMTVMTDGKMNKRTVMDIELNIHGQKFSISCHSRRDRCNLSPTRACKQSILDV